ncbi:MAG: SUMF1/EgtB/PvdO family nonheme iron enzyme [Gemmataceae bacterium]|nr:SUMF1/EgtB/PvdO family nonheme iron enzyme [Gemmataceae bacterium]
MPATLTCPPPDELMAALFGASGSDPAAMEAHFESCPRCQSMIQGAMPAGESIADRLRTVAASNACDDPEFRAAVDRVLRSDPRPAQLQPGDTVREYRLEELLGAGGMGTVWKARHTRLDMIVALKVMARRLHGDPAAEQRFAREMKAVGRLRHPNIIQAHDAGEADGRPYLAMEYAPGKDLAQYVREHGPFTPEAASGIIRQAALGLNHAHEAGLVHRDVKPSNLLLTSDGTVKILDLGLARLGDDDTVLPHTGDSTRDSELTGASRVIGTRDYMAPEQFRDARAVDARADVYSLGCTLIYLLTGRPPRLGDESAAPPAVANVLKKCLAPDPADRWPSAAALAAALEAPSRPPGRRLGGRVGIAIAIAVAVLPAGWWWFGGIATGDGETADAPRPPLLGRIPMTPVEAKQLQGQCAQLTSRRVTIKTSLGATFALIPPGEFGMSTECRVTISKPFYIGTHEVTVGEFKAFVDATGYKTKCETDGKGGWRMDRSDYHNMQQQSTKFTWRTPGYPDVSDQHPVTQVGYKDALAFCAWLSERDKTTYRLPTEAEWRWACRAGSAGDYYWGNDKVHLKDHAWHILTSMDQPQPVGMLKPNAWGLFDTLGNVEEWCLDWHGDYPDKPVTDYRGPATGKARVLAGGSHTQTRIDCAVRNPGGNTGFAFAGFRIVRELDDRP